MNYKIERKSPYEQKKISFGKKVRSKLIILFVCGTVAIMSGRISSMHTIAKETEKNQITITYYDELLDEIALYIKQYSGGNPETCFKLYTQLLWNGYFSNNRSHQYSTIDRNNIIGNYGVRIATGEGDCKNNEDFFCKMMQKIGYHAYQMACTQNDLNFFGNHVITVVDYNGVEYYFDTTNACSYQKCGINEVANENKQLTVTLKPIISYIYGYNDEQETLQFLYHQINSKSGEDYEFEKEMNRYFMSDKKILQLRKAIEPNLQNICNSIVKEG